MGEHYVDLGKGEADVALRSGDTVDTRLIGRNIADSLWAVHGGRDYLAQHAWVGFDETMARHRATLWRQQRAGNGSLRQSQPGACDAVQGAG